MTDENPKDVVADLAPVVAADPVEAERVAAETAAAEVAKRNREVDVVVGRRTRRAFLTGAIAAAAGVGAYRFLRTRPRVGDLPAPLRTMLQGNERLARAYFSPERLSPTFRGADITKLRANGRQGLTPNYDPTTWRLSIEGATQPATLTIEDIRALPVHEMICELRCIEGWSIIVQWKGARLRDLLERHPPAGGVDYLALETPGRGYYVGLDMESALHPQTLLVYEMNGQPLTLVHGAPLRLAIPVKYGIKNIKRIGTIRYSKERPADFWGDRGYDWYAGL
jgi:DMSO/TMAO reductase YedYZ molybdopterin-dependent catalytic subunit